MHTRDGANPEKMDCFEAIRGVAALGVLFGHLIIAFWPHLYIGAREIPTTYPPFVRWFALSPLKVLYDAQFAVTLFFLLSGFVLSLSYFRSRSVEVLTSAAVRRYFRLMLPAAASILLAFLLLKMGWLYNRRASEYMSQSLGAPHTWLGLFYNFGPHLGRALRECVWDAFFAGSSTYNANLWTMAIELAGSFVVYQFLALFGTARNRWLLYAVLGGVFVYSGKLFLLDFVLGMMLCDVYVATLAWRRRLPVLLAVPVALGGLYVVTLKPFGQYDWGWLRLEKNPCFEMLSGVLLLGAVAFSPRMQRLFAHRVLSFFGKISFGLYLIHLCLICSVASGVYLLLCRKLGMGHHPAALMAAGACVAASLAGAWLMYLTVDRPAIAVGKWLYRALFQKKAEAVADAPPQITFTTLPLTDGRVTAVSRKSA
jgi:peptidoglycan/LPS O-acetylase OafA/YrhL